MKIFESEAGGAAGCPFGVQTHIETGKLATQDAQQPPRTERNQLIRQGMHAVHR